MIHFTDEAILSNELFGTVVTTNSVSMSKYF